MFPDSILFSWLIQDSANCSFVQSIFGHELDGKSNVVNLSCKEIVAIFTMYMLETEYLVHTSFLVKTLVGLPLLKECFEVLGNEKNFCFSQFLWNKTLWSHHKENLEYNKRFCYFWTSQLTFTSEGNSTMKHPTCSWQLMKLITKDWLEKTHVAVDMILMSTCTEEQGHTSVERKR